MHKIGAVIALDGEKQYKAALTACNKATKEFNAELSAINQKYHEQSNTIDALNAKNKLLGQRLDVLAREAKTWKAALEGSITNEKKWSEQVQKLEGELREAQQRLDNLTNSQEENNEETEKATREVAKLEKQLNKAKTNWVRSVSSVSEYNGRLKENEAQTTECNRQLEKNNEYLAEAKAHWSGTATSINKYGNEVKDASTKTKTFGDVLKANLTAYGVIAAVQTIWLYTERIGGALLEAGMGFEQTMSTVKSLSGATVYEMQQLEAAARKMGETTIYTASESASALEYMALAGWQAEQMISGLPGVINLAAASSMDLAEASDILTDVMTALGDTAQESTRYADVLALTQASTNTTVSQLGEAFKYTAATAGSYNYTIEDLSAALGLMANAAIKGSSAGTYLSMIITRLTNNTSGARDALNGMGIDFYDATGNARPLRDVMTEMITVLQSYNDEQRAGIVNAIAGKRASEGLNAIIRQGADAYTNLVEKLDQSSGAAERIQRIMLDNLQGDVTIMKSALESLGITIYDVFDDTFRSAVQTATSQVNKFNDKISMNSGVGKAIKDLGKQFEKSGDSIVNGLCKALELAVKLTTAFIKHADGIIRVFSAIGVGVGVYKAMNVAISTTSMLKNTFKLLTKKVTEEQLKENMAVYMNPYVALATAIGVATVALGGYLIKLSHESNVNRELIDSTNELTDAVEAQANTNKECLSSWEDSVATIDAQSDVAKGLADELFDLQSSTMDSASKYEAMSQKVSALNELIPGLNLVIDEETGLLNQNRKAIDEVIDGYNAYSKAAAARTKLQEITEEQINTDIELYKAKKKLEEAEKSYHETQYTGISNCNAAIRGNSELGKSVEELKEQINSLEGTQSDLADEYDIVTGYMNENAEAAGIDASALEGIGDSAITATGEIETALSESEEAIDSFRESIASSVEDALTSFDLLSTEPEYSLQELSDNLNANQIIVQQWSDNIAALSQAGLSDGLIAELRDAGPETAGLVSMLASNLTDGKMNDALQAYSDAWDQNTNLVELVTNNVTETSNALTESSATAGENAGSAIAEGFATGAESATEEIAGAITDTVNTATETAQETVAQSTESVGTAAVEGIAKGIEASTDNVLNKIKSLTIEARNTAGLGMPQSTYRSIGSNVTSGMASGISYGTPSVVSAISSLCDQVVAEANRKLEIKSPSRVFKKMGTYSIQGYVQGINDSSSMANEAVSNALNFSAPAKVTAQSTSVGYGDIANYLSDVLPAAIVNALANSGLSFQCSEYEFGKLVREVM